MPITRIYDITTTADGTGAITATIELLNDDESGTGLRGVVTLNKEQYTELLTLFQGEGLPSLKSRLLEMAGEIDQRFTPEAITAYLVNNATSSDVVDRIVKAEILPLDIQVDLK